MAVRSSILPKKSSAWSSRCQGDRSRGAGETRATARALYDKGREGRYNLISALHQAVRGSGSRCGALLFLPHARRRRGSSLHREAARAHGGGGHRARRSAGARHHQCSQRPSISLGSPRGKKKKPPPPSWPLAGSRHLSPPKKKKKTHPPPFPARRRRRRSRTPTYVGTAKAAVRAAGGRGRLAAPKVILNAPTNLMEGESGDGRWPRV